MILLSFISIIINYLDPGYYFIQQVKHISTLLLMSTQ